MAEYLAPGVYLEETDSTPTPIPGVSTSIDDATARTLTESVRRVVNVPDWTDSNESDPGVTLIELFAWLAESLVYGQDGASRARSDAARRAFARLSQPSCTSLHAPLVRPRFFAGQLLDAATLAAEQDYLREKLRRHNRALHGFGIVSGLDVRIEPADGVECIVVEPGYALDACGEEFEIVERVTVPLPSGANELFVSLRHGDRPCNPVPGPSGPEAAGIEEASILATTATVPATAVGLARLRRETAGWSIDASFAAPRAR
ncbi:MAG TPA: hypothetical protein VGE10_08505 [Zeimonas sp.]